MRPHDPLRDFILAARVPETVAPQSHGRWTIERRRLDGVAAYMAGTSVQTILHQATEATLHREVGHIVMEDSRVELARHFPFWKAARGRVLVCGLGLGCIARALLAKPEVTHVDVIEIDSWIVQVIGAEFTGNPRIRVILGDALTFEPDQRYDYAWHDICTDDDVGLQGLHAQLLRRFHDWADHQGAWAFPREIARQLPIRLIGTPRRRRRAA